MRLRAPAIAALLGSLVAWIGYLTLAERAPASLVFLLYPGVFAWVLSGGVHASPFNEHMGGFIAVTAAIFWAAVFLILIWFARRRAADRR